MVKSDVPKAPEGMICLIAMVQPWFRKSESFEALVWEARIEAEPTRKVTKRQEAYELPENGKCLCIFDVDRTLTSRP